MSNSSMHFFVCTSNCNISGQNNLISLATLYILMSQSEEKFIIKSSLDSYALNTYVTSLQCSSQVLFCFVWRGDKYINPKSECYHAVCSHIGYHIVDF